MRLVRLDAASARTKSAQVQPLLVPSEADRRIAQQKHHAKVPVLGDGMKVPREIVVADVKRKRLVESTPDAQIGQPRRRGENVF